MKFIKSISVLTLLCCMALFVVSCGSGDSANDHEADHSHEETTHTHDDGTTHADHAHDEGGTAAAHGEGAAFTSAYVCPMHCEDSGSEEEGKCPACGMAYIAQADHVKDGHKHE